MTNQSTLAAAVYRGAALLDRHEPDWYTKIDLDTFNIWRADLCIVGQLRPEHSYVDGAISLLGSVPTLMHGAHQNACDDAKALGFDVPNHYTGRLFYTRACECLTRMWTRAIMARRNPITLYVTTI